MKTTIALEYIGEKQDAMVSLYEKQIREISASLSNAVVGKKFTRKPWVAKITNIDEKYGFSRQFLHANWQRSRSNAASSRGVYLYFILETGCVYEIRTFVSWSKEDRYFALIGDDGSQIRLNKKRVVEWLKTN